VTVRPGDEFDFWVTIYVESRINGFAFGVAIDATQFEILEGQHSDGVLALGPFHPNLSHAVGLGDELNDDPWNDPRRFGVVATALFPVLPAPGVSFPVEDNFPIISVRLRVLPRATGRALLEFSNELVPKLGAPHTIVNYSIQRVSTPPLAVVDGEILIEPDEFSTPFRRGDVDGNGRINISDALVAAQNIFLDRLVFFECDAMLDVTNDNQLDASDPIRILSWLFASDPSFAPPFVECSLEDPAQGLGLACNESNCRAY
jgi:hypothetical protein